MPAYNMSSGRSVTRRYLISWGYGILIEFVSHILDLLLVTEGLVGFI